MAIGPCTAKGSSGIKYAGTEEWTTIRDEGILAAVYDEALWDDHEEFVALMLGDNLNAAVQVGEDKVQASGRVGVIVTDLAHSQRDCEHPTHKPNCPQGGGGFPGARGRFLLQMVGFYSRRGVSTPNVVL